MKSFKIPTVFWKKQWDYCFWKEIVGLYYNSIKNVYLLCSYFRVNCWGVGKIIDKNILPCWFAFIYLRSLEYWKVKAALETRQLLHITCLLIQGQTETAPGEESWWDKDVILEPFDQIPKELKISDELSKFGGRDRVPKTSAVISEFNPLLPNKSQVTLYGDFWENDSVEDLIAR